MSAESFDRSQVFSQHYNVLLPPPLGGGRRGKDKDIIKDSINNLTFGLFKFGSSAGRTKLPRS